jgi:hypothetical protein
MQRARERAITDDTNVDERYDSLRPDGPARDRRNKGRRPRAAMLGVCRAWRQCPSEPGLENQRNKGKSTSKSEPTSKSKATIASFQLPLTQSLRCSHSRRFGPSLPRTSNTVWVGATRGRREVARIGPIGWALLGSPPVLTGARTVSRTQHMFPLAGRPILREHHPCGGRGAAIRRPCLVLRHEGSRAANGSVGAPERGGYGHLALARR